MSQQMLTNVYETGGMKCKPCKHDSSMFLPCSIRAYQQEISKIGQDMGHATCCHSQAGKPTRDTTPSLLDSDAKQECNKPAACHQHAESVARPQNWPAAGGNPIVKTRAIQQVHEAQHDTCSDSACKLKTEPGLYAVGGLDCRSEQQQAAS